MGKHELSVFAPHAEVKGPVIEPWVLQIPTV